MKYTAIPGCSWVDVLVLSAVAMVERSHNYEMAYGTCTSGSICVLCFFGDGNRYLLTGKKSVVGVLIIMFLARSCLIPLFSYILVCFFRYMFNKVFSNCVNCGGSALFGCY